MSADKGNHSFATKGQNGLDGGQANSGDSEEIFDDEEISSSECNSEESGYNSAADNADMFSQEGSIGPEKKINNLQNDSQIKIP